MLLVTWIIYHAVGKKSLRYYFREGMKEKWSCSFVLQGLFRKHYLYFPPNLVFVTKENMFGLASQFKLQV